MLQVNLQLRLDVLQEFAKSMQTILRVLDLARDARNESDLVALIDEESNSCIVNGDLLGAGEWLASRLNYSMGTDPNATTAKILALWASPGDLNFSPSSMADLISNLQEFDKDALSTALVGLTARRPKLIVRHPELLRDLGYRLSGDIRKLFSTDATRPSDVSERAAVNLGTMMSKAVDALGVFQNANCISARAPAMELLKTLRQLKPFVLVRERPLLSHADLLIGAGFREFCQSYERNEIRTVVIRLPDIRQQSQEALGIATNENSVIWQVLIKPIAKHLITITDEASRSCKLALTPSIKLASTLFKSDLTRETATCVVSARILNDGVGNATRVRLDPIISGVRVVSPREAFDLPAGADRIIEIECKVRDQDNSLTPITWLCADVSGEKYTFGDELRIEQQRAQPDWSALREYPPYSVNPIRTRARLFGREAQLDRLLLRAAAGTSTFIWGQKRVGKTSLLQVIQEEISNKNKFTCIFLRMGELMAMHEGQLAYTIASRLTSATPGSEITVPPEAEFGAGLGRLIPFIEGFVEARKGWRLVVIIDEFDDLEPAFYTGERGRLFVKALRSLSEIGLVFFFAGTERMNVIYTKHSLELNKWTNTFVDSIASIQDRRDLIMKPVQDQLEYHQAAADAIAEYCSGNPFFMHLVCSALFERCVAERRTFISDADFQSYRQILIETLGMTNFAHFWEDNPVLERDENQRYAAENCLVLCCIAFLGGSFITHESIWQQQDSLNLTSVERLSLREISTVIDRLRTRKVLTEPQHDGRVKIAVPIFGEWLRKHAELSLLPTWRRHAQDKLAKPREEVATQKPALVVLDAAFPIPEDDLLAVSQNLVFCGKQKDVAEIRSWLRQFDDDNRIEIAFSLLKRLVANGYVSDGAREYALSKLVEGVSARRLELGQGKWHVMRGRKDNLCLSYLDSDLKSGSSLTREAMKRLSPGKSGDAKEISNWMASHSEADPIVVLLDDFSATGSTISRGLERWKAEMKDPSIAERYFDENRVMLVLLYALGPAIDKVRESEPRLKVLSCNVLGSEVVAFDSDSGIFASAEEIDFAREVMLQIGRELTPQCPLGYGDLGLLVCFHNTVPNNTLPVFWSNGRVNERLWRPLFSRV
jgi:hypothetical protein